MHISNAPMRKHGFLSIWHTSVAFVSGKLLKADSNGAPVASIYGEDDITNLVNRMTSVEDIYVRLLWFEEISSGTSGTITPPTGGTIVLDQWAAGIDAVTSAITSGYNPTYESAKEADGTIITATLDGNGNWTISGTPSAYPIAILYVYDVKLTDLDRTKSLVELETDQGLKKTDSPTFANIMDTGLTASKVIVSDVDKKLISGTNTDAEISDAVSTHANKGVNADITSMIGLTQITRATGGAFDIALGSAAGDDFTVGTNKLVVEGDTGNVGIGTTLPVEPLKIHKDGRLMSDSLYSIITVSNNADQKGLYIGYDGNDTYNGMIASVSGSIGFWTVTGGAWGERVTILDTGNVGIGTTAPNYRLELSTDSAGKPGAGGLWTIVSDERIKKDIEPANLDRCLEIIKAIPLKRFGWAEETYSEKQVKDRHSLGWTAQDVQGIFPKAVNVTPFTKNEKIPDGDEEYEEQDFVMETVEQQTIEMVDGTAVLKTKSVEQQKLLFDEFHVQDEAGNIVVDKDKNPLIHKIPRMIKKTRPKFRQEVIEDCLDLNSGQIIAAMYGAVQKLIQKVEMLEAKMGL